MASIADQILIKMGLDSADLQKGLDRAKNELKSTSVAMDTMGAKWKATASMLTRTVIAPIAGFMSLGAVIKSYFSGVSQVAQLTGAYSTKMEEWRKKRAMLARYNREDIELYKKGREAVVKFQITMDDLSAKIMRTVSPAIKWLIDRLNNFSDWIDRNQNNIIRFFSVVAGVITTLLIPTFIRLGIAMLTNPLTWFIGLLGLLILVVDDLVTYLRGGDSLFGAFWKPCIEFTKQAWNWIKTFYNALVNNEAFKAFRNGFTSLFNHFWNGIGQLLGLIGDFFKTILRGGTDLSSFGQLLKGMFEQIAGAIEIVFGVIMGLFGGLVALFTGDTEVMKNAFTVMCDGLKRAFRGAENVITGIVKSIKNTFNSLLTVIDNLITAVMNFGKSIVNALNIDGIIEKAKTKLNNLMPDWVKSALGMEETQDGEPTIYAGTDAPIVPDTASMANMQAQKRGNINNNINRNQNFNINTNSPLVADQVVTSATREMNQEDLAISMASQEGAW